MNQSLCCSGAYALLLRFLRGSGQVAQEQGGQLESVIVLLKCLGTSVEVLKEFRISCPGNQLKKKTKTATCSGAAALEGGQLESVIVLFSVKARKEFRISCPRKSAGKKTKAATCSGAAGPQRAEVSLPEWLRGWTYKIHCTQVRMGSNPIADTVLSMISWGWGATAARQTLESPRYQKGKFGNLEYSWESA